MAATLLFAASVLPTSQGQLAGPVVPPVAESIDASTRPADEAWTQFANILNTPRSTVGRDSSAAALALKNASLARGFYSRYPQHPKAIEARKWETLLLIDAVAAGDGTSEAAMKANVRAFRSDPGVAVFERAVVAGTYEFHAANQRITKREDMLSEFEAVSRGLIREFPDQPQGYVSLLTQAQQRDSATQRTMVLEVLNATAAPAEVRTAAQRLITRLDLVGQSAEAILGVTIGNGAKTAWQPNRPGLLYFWATWSPDSLVLGKSLADRKLANANVVGVCLDRDHDGIPPIAAAQSLPGNLIYLFEGLNDDLAIRLGANAAPLLYFVDADGRFTDVRGLDDLENKLTAMGL